MDAVRNMAKGLNKNIAKQVASHTDEDLATEVWALTKEELDKGLDFLRRPGKGQTNKTMV
jgi:hypothetical protein